jgi:hypothetical protein
MNPSCHVCRLEEIPVVLDLGLQPCGERLLEPYELGDPEPRQPLRLAFCPRCQILQRADPSAEGFPSPATSLGSPALIGETDSLDRFLSGLKNALEPQGAAVVSLHDAAELASPRLLKILQLRQRLHLTVENLQSQLHQHDLEAFQVEQCPAATGLLRIFVGHRGAFPVGASIAEKIQADTQQGLGTQAFWETLGRRVETFRERLLGEIRDIRGAGQRLCGYGASACGSLLLNHCGLGRDGFDAIDFVLDPSPKAAGRITPGSHLAILPVAELEKRFIKVVLLLDPGLEADAQRQTECWQQQGGRIFNPWVQPI